MSNSPPPDASPPTSTPHASYDASTTSVAFEAPDVADRLARLSPEALDALPFGVIRLDAAGRVTIFSRGEADGAGYTASAPIGVHYFTQVAPCMNTPALRGEIEAAAARGRVDLEFGHTGDFGDRDRFLRIRVVSAGDGGYWHLHDRS